MITVAHRGVFFPKDKQNTYAGVCALNKKDVDMVEIDVRYSTDRKVVLCHDRECRNERKNDNLLSFLNKCFDIPIMLDIKAFGILEAQRLARSVVDILSKSQHKNGWLCSFNEYCVAELVVDSRERPERRPRVSSGSDFRGNSVRHVQPFRQHRLCLAGLQLCV